MTSTEAIDVTPDESNSRLSLGSLTLETLLIPRYATLAKTVPCDQVILSAHPVGDCPPTVISDIDNVITGCQAGGFTTVINNGQLFLRVPAAGCYNVTLNMSCTIAGITDQNSTAVKFGVLKNGANEYLFTPATVRVRTTIFDVSGDIPVNVSTSSTVCLQTGDLIAPCASRLIVAGALTTFVYTHSYTLTAVRVSSC